MELVKCYTHGDQLNEALEALENAFNKPDFIISEIYRNLKLLPSITTFKAIKTAKEQVQTLKVSLATLRTMGYEKDLIQDSNLQNTFILVDLEGKIPLEGYTAWMVEKNCIKTNNKTPNLDDFTKFYEKLVNQQADAIYIRKQLEELSSDTKDRASRRDKGARRDNRGDKSGDKGRGKGQDSANLLNTNSSEKEQDGKDGPTEHGQPIKGKYKKAFCIFEKCYGHGSAFCLNTKFDSDFKMKCAKQEKVCLVCLRIADHKEKDCSNKIKKCLICGETHNCNLHARKDVIAAFKRQKETNNTNKQQ